MSLWRAGLIHPDPAGGDWVLPSDPTPDNPSVFQIVPINSPWRVNCFFDVGGQRHAASADSGFFLEWLTRRVFRPSEDDLRSNCAAFARVLLFGEAEAYLQHLLRERGFSITVGEKTRFAIREVFDNGFSLGQFFCLAWMACRGVSDYYQRSHVSRRQAANTVPGALLRYVDRATTTDWVVKSYRRNFDLPLPALSELFFSASLDRLAQVLMRR